MLYRLECWPITKALANRVKVAELRMLRWTCGKTMLDMIPNRVYRAELEVSTIINKMKEGQLRWFEHARRRPQSAPPVRRVDALVVDGLRRRDRPKLRLLALFRSFCICTMFFHAYACWLFLLLLLFLSLYAFSYMLALLYLFAFSFLHHLLITLFAFLPLLSLILYIVVFAYLDGFVLSMLYACIAHLAMCLLLMLV
ncbi:hypothetical protein Tco_0867454 [Tanacetum coccineum]